METTRIAAEGFLDVSCYFEIAWNWCFFDSFALFLHVACTLNDFLVLRDWYEKALIIDETSPLMPEKSDEKA